MKFATTLIGHYPSHLRQDAALPWKIKNSIFWQIRKKMDKILIKSLYLNGYTAKRLTDEFPEKAGVNEQLKKLRDTNNLQAVAHLAVPALKKR